MSDSAHDGPKEKPPLGVMPERLWKERRISDLIRAIGEYADDPNRKPKPEWCLELADLLVWYADSGACAPYQREEETDVS